jgi:integration host factor subunit beta
MADALVQGDRIEIRGIGSFLIRDYGEYRGRNPKAGRRIKVPRKKYRFSKSAEN